MFYHFSQNNSGGWFDFDKEQGLTHHVIIEADSTEAANTRAKSIGIYFGGVMSGIDCNCCGDRWDPVWEEGTDEPMVYGDPVAEVEQHWMRKKGPEAVVHYLDGRVEWFGGEHV